MNNAYKGEGAWLPIRAQVGRAQAVKAPEVKAPEVKAQEVKTLPVKGHIIRRRNIMKP